MFTRLLGVVGGVAFTVRYGLGLWFWQVANRLEKPRYRVVEKLGSGVELRAYEEYTVAECTFRKPTSMQTATAAGFRKCAGYIFGRNRKHGAHLWGRSSALASEKMAMTSPVRMAIEQSDEGDTEPIKRVKVSFLMASNYSMSQLPVPDDADVKLKRVPAHFMAAVKFNGAPPTSKKIREKKQLVLDQMTKAAVGRAVSGEALVYGYHDPFITPNLLRKNEVGVFVDMPKCV